MKRLKTVDEIYGEMMEVFARETGMEPDGTGELAVRMYALAAQVAALYQEAEWTRRQCFPQTATGEELDKHAFLRGLRRNPAGRAAGTLRFFLRTAVEEDLTIPTGTVCMTAGMVAFETIQESVLPAGQVEVDIPAQAVEAGPGGNTPAGTIRTMAVAPVGIAGCTNPTPFTGGCREEGDEELRERILATFRQLPNGTNGAYYAREAMEVNGVAAVQVLPKNRGLGTVDLYISATEGMPSPELVEQVKNRLESRREIGVSLQVLAPTPRPVDVLVQVKPREGRTVGTVLQQVRDALSVWFDGTLLGNDVLLARLGQVIYQVDGVENYRFYAPAYDVKMGKGQIPVLGNLSVEEMT